MPSLNFHVYVAVFLSILILGAGYALGAPFAENLGDFVYGLVGMLISGFGLSYLACLHSAMQKG